MSQISPKFQLITQNNPSNQDEISSITFKKERYNSKGQQSNPKT